MEKRYACTVTVCVYVTNHNAKHSTVKNKLFSHIKILDCVECVIIRRWQGYAMTSDQGACAGQLSLTVLLQTMCPYLVGCLS